MPMRIWVWKLWLQAEFAHKDDYEKTFPDVKEGTILYDDPTAYELEELAQRLNIDLMGAGVKEKYVYHKMGIPSVKCTPGITAGLIMVLTASRFLHVIWI